MDRYISSLLLAAIAAPTAIIADPRPPDAGSSSDSTIGTTDYVQAYSSALHKDNFYGVQFHPEKSAQAGEKILRNFVTDHNL